MLHICILLINPYAIKLFAAKTNLYGGGTMKKGELVNQLTLSNIYDASGKL